MAWTSGERADGERPGLGQGPTGVSEGSASRSGDADEKGGSRLGSDGSARWPQKSVQAPDRPRLLELPAAWRLARTLGTGAAISGHSHPSEPPFEGRDTDAMSPGG